VLIRSLSVGALALYLVGCGSDAAAPSGAKRGERAATGGDTAGDAAAGGATAAGGAGGSAAVGADTDGGTVSEPGAPSLSDATDITFKMDSFEVPPGGEFYKCQDFPNTFPGNVAILESKSEMTAGSHHMFVFRLSTQGFYGGMSNLGPGNTKGPIVDCPGGGTEFHPYVHTAQTLSQEFTYPPGLGQAFNSDETARVMVHYLNTTSDPIPANVTVTMKYVGADQVKALAASVFLNSLGIQVPPGKSTQSFTYTLPLDVNLLGAAGHMHRRGIHFSGSAVDAAGKSTDLYATDDWNEPVAAAFSPPIALANGTAINWSCTYSNDTGKTLRFGESASTNEMCIFTGTYYPAPGGGGIYDQDFTAGTSTAQ
jgi:hypothetical protein